MQLQQYIKELLYQHECVTVPNFGAFLTRTIDVLIQPDSGLFSPPGKEVSFNHLLKSNDGILAQYIAQKENVTYEQALRKIDVDRAFLLTPNSKIIGSLISFSSLSKILKNFS